MTKWHNPGEWVMGFGAGVATASVVWVFLLGALLLGGCAPGFPVLPQAYSVAERADVQQIMAEAPECEPPTFAAVSPERLEEICGVPSAYPLGSAEGRGGVYACCGWTYGGKPVAVYDERLPESWLPTIYRHETNHILVTCSTGRSDPKHADETWDSADLWLFGLVRGGT